MVLLFGHSDLEVPILCYDRFGVIPLEIVCLPVMKVDSFKIWVITGPECAIWSLEFVRKYKLKCLRRIVEGGDGPGALRGVYVDEARVTVQLGYLHDG